jgi:GMP synthase-like glutamine amidotransferase
MILVYNCVSEPDASKRYEKNLIKKINTNKDLLFTTPGNAEKDMEGKEFTHLIISGSAASAIDNNTWDGELSSVIDDFFEGNKAILGICYGHQFLAAWLEGKSCLYVMDKPEYGWNEVKIKANPLFENVSSGLFCHIHGDSVSRLADKCILIAENETGIQGFQYEGRNIFAVQFHPDYNYEEAKEVFERKSAANPKIKEVYKNKTPGDSTDIDGARILNNFLNM